jgi:hypothetical protein
MKMFEALLLVIAAAMVIYFVWNYRNAKSHPNRRKNNDIRYYELKSKYEFLVSIVTLVTVVFVFLGISSQRELKDEIQKNIDKELISSKNAIDSTKRSFALFRDSINVSLETYNNVLSASIVNLNKMSDKQNLIYQKSLKSNLDLDKVQNTVSRISKLNVLKKEFYVIDDLQVDNKTAASGNSFRLFFKDLKTNTGDNLPNFTSEPLVLASNLDGGVIKTIKTTDDYVDVLVETIHNGEINAPFFRYKLVIYY